MSVSVFARLNIVGCNVYARVKNCLYNAVGGLNSANDAHKVIVRDYGIVNADAVETALIYHKAAVSVGGIKSNNLRKGKDVVGVLLLDFKIALVEGDLDLQRFVVNKLAFKLGNLVLKLLNLL